MMKLTVSLMDNGKPREAIPVRAIPFVTGWNFSPDAIANAFAQTDEARRMKGVGSFRTTANRLTQVKAIDWEHVKVSMDGLDDKLPRSPAGYSEWRSKSIELLPAGTFVWLDEFATAFQIDFSPSNWLPNCRKEYPALDFDPMLPEGAESIIYEGFPAFQEATEATSPPPSENAHVDYQGMPYGPERDTAIYERLNNLRASGVRAFQAQTARDFVVSPSAIKDAVNRHKSKSKPKSSPSVHTSLAAQLNAANKRQKK